MIHSSPSNSSVKPNINIHKMAEGGISDLLEACHLPSETEDLPNPGLPSTPIALSRWDWKNEHKNRMGNLLDSGFLSDITLIVGSERKVVKAHRLFLQAGSPTLHKKLKSMKQSEEKEDQLIFEDVGYDSFLMFLRFLYTGETGKELTDLSSLPLLKIATDYDVTTLADICANKAKWSLSEGNVIHIFQQAMECGHKDLIDNSLAFICRNGWKLVMTDGFLELRQECLYEILKRDDLQVRSEIQLFHAVAKWAEAECRRGGREPGDWDNIRHAMSKVIGLIRFPVMDQADFTLNVALKNILGLEELVSILLYFTVPIDKRSEIPPGRFNSSPRKYHKEHQGLNIQPEETSLLTAPQVTTRVSQDRSRDMVEMRPDEPSPSERVPPSRNQDQLEESMTISQTEASTSATATAGPGGRNTKKKYLFQLN